MGFKLNNWAFLAAIFSAAFKRRISIGVAPFSHVNSLFFLSFFMLIQVFLLSFVDGKEHDTSANSLDVCLSCLSSSAVPIDN